MDPKVIFQLNVISMRYMLYVQKMKLTSAILTRPPCCEGGQVSSGRCRNRSAVLGGSSRGPRTLTQMSANQSQWSNITCILKAYSQRNHENSLYLFLSIGKINATEKQAVCTAQLWNRTKHCTSVPITMGTLQLTFAPFSTSSLAKNRFLGLTVCCSSSTPQRHINRGVLW